MRCVYIYLPTNWWPPVSPVSFPNVLCCSFHNNGNVSHFLEIFPFSRILFSLQGKFWSHFGHMDGGRKTLYAEEAMFLLDEVSVSPCNTYTYLFPGEHFTFTYISFSG